MWQLGAGLRHRGRENPRRGISGTEHVCTLQRDLVTQFRVRTAKLCDRDFGLCTGAARSAFTCSAADSGAGQLPGSVRAVRVGETAQHVRVPDRGCERLGTGSAWAGLRCWAREVLPREVAVTDRGFCADKVTLDLTAPTSEAENQPWLVPTVLV